MRIRVNLYTNLQQYTGGRNQVFVNGTTIGECLKDLVQQYPDIGPVLFDDKGELNSIVYVSVNMNSVNPEKLNREIRENDELFIILIIAGG
jgi:molybdopterin converting factor small subunit